MLEGQDPGARPLGTGSIPDIPDDRMRVGNMRVSSLSPGTPLGLLDTPAAQDSNLVCGQGGLVRPSGVGLARELPATRPWTLCLPHRDTVSATGALCVCHRDTVCLPQRDIVC